MHHCAACTLLKKGEGCKCACHESDEVFKTENEMVGQFQVETTEQEFPQFIDELSGDSV